MKANLLNLVTVEVDDAKVAELKKKTVLAAQKATFATANVLSFLSNKIEKMATKLNKKN